MNNLLFEFEKRTGNIFHYLPQNNKIGNSFLPENQPEVFGVFPVSTSSLKKNNNNFLVSPTQFQGSWGNKVVTGCYITKFSFITSIFLWKKINNYFLVSPDALQQGVGVNKFGDKINLTIADSLSGLLILSFCCFKKIVWGILNKIKNPFFTSPIIVFRLCVQKSPTYLIIIGGE